MASCAEVRNGDRSKLFVLLAAARHRRSPRIYRARVSESASSRSPHVLRLMSCAKKWRDPRRLRRRIRVEDK